MRLIRKRDGKFLTIDLAKNEVESFDTMTQAELFQVFEGTIDEFWNVDKEDSALENEFDARETTTDWS